MGRACPWSISLMKSSLQSSTLSVVNCCRWPDAGLNRTRVDLWRRPRGMIDWLFTRRQNKKAAPAVVGLASKRSVGGAVVTDRPTGCRCHVRREANARRLVMVGRSSTTARWGVWTSELRSAASIPQFHHHGDSKMQNRKIIPRGPKNTGVLAKNVLYSIFTLALWNKLQK